MLAPAEKTSRCECDHCHIPGGFFQPYDHLNVNTEVFTGGATSVMKEEYFGKLEVSSTCATISV